MTVLALVERILLVSCKQLNSWRKNWLISHKRFSCRLAQYNKGRKNLWSTLIHVCSTYFEQIRHQTPISFFSWGQRSDEERLNQPTPCFFRRTPLLQLSPVSNFPRLDKLGPFGGPEGLPLRSGHRDIAPDTQVRLGWDGLEGFSQNNLAYWASEKSRLVKVEEVAL